MKKTKIYLFAVIFLACAANASGEVAELIEYTGSVNLLRSGETEWTDVSLELGLNRGDRLRTGVDSTAELKFYAGHTASLDPSSSMMIKEATADKTEIDFFEGRMRSRVRRLSSGQIYEISTPQAVCAVRGTEFSVTAQEDQTRVDVFSGIVEARETITGLKVDIGAGHFSRVVRGREPTKPQAIPALSVPEQTRIPSPAPGRREAARREMFNEISRAAVLARAAQEIKQAEYENRKVMVDAYGHRVRLEEYIVRPQNANTDFKYVVLNHRDERLDFGKIHFMFSAALPEDLTLVTGSMFSSREKPDIILTDMFSVISNTRDSVNEDATGGKMIQDRNNIWRHYFTTFAFSIKGEGRERLTLWTRNIGAVDSFEETRLADNITITYDDDAGALETTVTEYPSGTDKIHIRKTDTYADGTWLTVNDFIIDDEGDIQSKNDLRNTIDLNAQRKYESSEFGDRNINLVFSTKLLLDAGILD